MVKVKNLIYFAIFFLTLIISNQLIFLFFDITKSPDYTVYSSYFDYFFDNTDNVEREQGLTYYFFNSLIIKYYNTFFKFSELSYLLNKSIYTTNYLIYFFGIIGYYNLLKFYKFSTKNILIALSFLNFFPITFMLRMTLKPEIMAFSIIPWILFLFEKYFESNELVNLFLSIPFLVVLMTSKGSIFAISSVFFSILFLKKFIDIDRKHLLFFTITFIIFITLTSFENQKSGVSNIFDISSGSGEKIAEDSNKYNNQASPSIVYKVNMYNLLTSPIDNLHKDSFIAITLLDSFGDYFKLYWNNNDSLFFKDRIELIKVEKTNYISFPQFGENNLLTIYVQKDTDVYFRESISLLFGGLFFITLLVNIIKKDRFTLFLVSPFIGSTLILFHVITGYPKNNFDPMRGDSLKPFYYSFLLCLSFVFLTLIYLKKNRKTKYLLIPYLLVLSFLFGFPKNIEKQKNELLEINSYSSTCELNKYLIDDKLEIKNCNLNFEFNNNQQFSKYSGPMKFPYFQSFQIMVIIFGGLYMIIYSSIFKKKSSNIINNIR